MMEPHLKDLFPDYIVSDELIALLSTKTSSNGDAVKYLESYFVRFASNLRHRFKVLFSSEAKLKEYMGPEAYEVMRLISSAPEVDYRKTQTSFMSKHPDSFDLISNFPMTVIESLSFLAGQYLLGDMKVSFTKLFSINILI